MAIAERVVSRESIAQTVEKYIPSQEILEAYLFPDPLSLSRKEIFEKTLPGAIYSLTYSHLERKLVIVPTWHPLNTSPIPNHAGDYGSGVFEGHSLEPVVKDGKIVGANLILHEPRMRRLQKSLENRDFSLPVSITEFSRGIIDLSSILGEDVLRSSDGTACRAYVRPEARPGMGGFGVGVKREHLIDAAVVCWNWPYYFKDPERVYSGSGLTVAVFPEQRLTRITGKHASNYGEAGIVGNRARGLGADEALFFGPYIVWPVNRKREYINAQDGVNIDKLLIHGVLADGPGEEVLAISSTGELWYPPMNVNRLGGTTLNYITQYLAPELDITVKEKPFTIFDIKTGFIETLIFAGNASRIAPIGKIMVFGHDSYESLETVPIRISDTARALVERYEAEVKGLTPPSHASLLTPVDLVEGQEAKKVLNRVYRDWI